VITQQPHLSQRDTEKVFIYNIWDKAETIKVQQLIIFTQTDHFSPCNNSRLGLRENLLHGCEVYIYVSKGVFTTFYFHFSYFLHNYNELLSYLSFFYY
jgi:hypothetical protein